MQTKMDRVRNIGGKRNNAIKAVADEEEAFVATEERLKQLKESLKDKKEKRDELETEYSEAFKDLTAEEGDARARKVNE